jgi:hypothetical protein
LRALKSPAQERSRYAQGIKDVQHLIEKFPKDAYVVLCLRTDSALTRIIVRKDKERIRAAKRRLKISPFLGRFLQAHGSQESPSVLELLKWGSQNDDPTAQDILPLSSLAIPAAKSDPKKK